MSEYKYGQQLYSLLTQLPNANNTTTPEHIYLLGTIGCHLCVEAEKTVKQLQAVIPISYGYVDIIDLPDEWMEQLSTNIPVIITETKHIDYPFSIMDLQAMYLS